MPKFFIFEDEPAALNRLTRLINELRPHYQLAGTADNIEDAIKLIQDHQYDFIFSDIQLSDGLCFEIFEKIDVSKPIIFITAYDEYAITAFKYNGLHYILKPINIEILLEAIIKFEKNQLIQPDFSTINYQSFQKKELQKRIISKMGNKLKVIEIKQIAFLYTDNSITYALTFDGKNFALDQNLDSIFSLLSEKEFFRINRQMIININAVIDMIFYSSNRFKLTLSIPIKQDIIVSKEKCSLFKNWIASH